MTDAPLPAPPFDAAARVVAFATAGAFQAAQDLVGRAVAGLQDVADAGSPPDVPLVAEETLALVAVATARAASVGLRAHPEAARATTGALLALPDLYRDYFAGLAILTDPDVGANVAAHAERDTSRTDRKRAFYDAHLPDGQFPTEATLASILPLWMGRISGPGLPEPPDARLARLALAPALTAHLKLVVAFARKTMAA